MNRPADIPLLAPPGGQGPPADPAPAVQAALSAVAAPARLTIAVNDPQRHTDTRAVLRALAARIDLSRCRILVAAGSHRFWPDDRAAFERHLLEDLPVAATAWHDARAADLVPIGGADGWRGHRWLLEADAVLAVGSVEPHYFAGFTGAHKTATIGCASHRDIESNHAWAVREACQPCRLDGNPVHERIAELLGALEGVRRVGAVNLVQPGRHVQAALGGEVLSALRQAAPIARRAFTCRVAGPADALVAEVSGPLGRSFYQADKGIKNNEQAVRDGGCLVLSAPCPDGIGQDAFLNLLAEAPDGASAEALVSRRGYRLGDHKALRLRRLTDPAGRAVRLMVVSDGLDEEQVRRLGGVKCRSVREALAAAGIDPARDAVYRVCDAGNTCVLVEVSA